MHYWLILVQTFLLTLAQMISGAKHDEDNQMQKCDKRDPVWLQEYDETGSKRTKNRNQSAEIPYPLPVWEGPPPPKQAYSN